MKHLQIAKGVHSAQHEFARSPPNITQPGLGYSVCLYCKQYISTTLEFFTGSMETLNKRKTVTTDALSARKRVSCGKA